MYITAIAIIAAGFVFRFSFCCSVQSAVTGLHVGIDKNIIPMDLFVDRVTEEDPDSVLRSLTDRISALNRKIRSLLEYSVPFCDGVDLQLVSENTGITFLRIICCDDAG